MGNRVFIYGDFYSDDLKYLLPHDDLYISNHSSLGIETFDDFLKIAEQWDLVIFPWEGNSLHQVVQSHKADARFQSFFSNLNIKKAFWSMDSHHQHGLEQLYQNLFDTYYIAHAAYVTMYDKVPTKWLPCSYILSSIDKLVLDATLNVPEQFDVSCIFRSYAHIGDRNHTIYEIEKRLKKLGLSYFLGSIDPQQATWTRYINIIRSSRVVLNVSIMDDFNLRNFEAWGLNKVLLCNKTLDHELIKADFSHTYLFDKNLINFDEQLDKALSDRALPINTSVNVLNNHMKIHRFIEIINNELGTSYRIADVSNLCLRQGTSEKMELPVQISSTEGDVLYNNSPEFALKAVLALVNMKKYEQAITELHIIYAEHSLENMKQAECQMVLFSVLMKTYSDYNQSKEYTLLTLIFLLIDGINKTISLRTIPQQYITRYIQCIADLSEKSDLLLYSQAKEILQNQFMHVINIFASQNSWQQVMTLIEQISPLKRPHLHLQWMKIVALLTLGKIEQSVEAALQYMKLYPHSSPYEEKVKKVIINNFHIALRQYIDENEMLKAETLIGVMLIIMPNDPSLYAMSGYCHRLRGDVNAADIDDQRFVDKYFAVKK